jgi:hypothetical protein
MRRWGNSFLQKQYNRMQCERHREEVFKVLQRCEQNTSHGSLVAQNGVCLVAKHYVCHIPNEPLCTATEGRQLDDVCVSKQCVSKQLGMHVQTYV